MALKTIGTGTEIVSGDLNDNFEYLDGRITATNSSISTVQSNVSSLNSNISSQISQLQQNIEDSTSAVYQYSGSAFTLKEMVVADTLNPNTVSTSSHSDAVWLYTTPVYPYVPLTTQESGTSHTFTNGGMVICTSATNVTVGQGTSSIEFTGMVGILPVSVGSVVTTNINAYFASY